MKGESPAEFLTNQLEQRCQKNARYSLRAFARDISLSPAMLSQVIGGSKGLSREAAAAIASRLGLNEHETRRWVTLVESHHARSKKMRAAAKKRLAALGQAYSPLDADAFRVISEWYHLAILSLTETRGFENQERWIAQRLGISIYEAREAIRRLKKLEMLEETGQGLKPTGVFFANPAGIPSRSVRSFHSQILKKAEAALELQTTEERDFSSLVVAVDANQIDEAKRAIREFREAFEARFCASSTSKNEVYTLGIQFFRLTQSDKMPNQTRRTK